jgi:hypothetical protein
MEIKGGRLLLSMRPQNQKRVPFQIGRRDFLPLTPKTKYSACGTLM